MARHDLNDFTWMGEPLSNPPDWVNGVEYEEVTPLDLTTWLVDKFRLSTQRDISRLLDETQTVRRLFSPREVQDGWSNKDAEWDITKATHAFGIAMYIFCENKAAEQCNTCRHRASIGPAEECVVDKGGRAQGACTNCYYKGRGGTCSHRVHAAEEGIQTERKREAEAEAEALVLRLPGLKERLEEMPEDQLRDWVAVAEMELEARKLMRMIPGLTRSQIEDYTVFEIIKSGFNGGRGADQDGRAE